MPPARAPDARQDRLAAWAANALGTPDFTLARASEDASFRRYFRMTLATPWHGHASVIAMDTVR